MMRAADLFGKGNGTFLYGVWGTVPCLEDACVIFWICKAEEMVGEGRGSRAAKMELWVRV